MTTDDAASPGSGTIRRQHRMREDLAVNQITFFYRSEEANKQQRVVYVRNCLRLRGSDGVLAQARRGGIHLTSEGGCCSAVSEELT